ncbi:hypothetical protein KIW84_072237 [Lathyrus oleraceus]|uniref:Uncharacterized protein n=1 Tax=Pisum sativum TaxID=3888 RepID=A0A9D4VMX3_PEA|nr:hypothetical protein KIW84_072237 [Pisum sativum]
MEFRPRWKYRMEARVFSSSLSMLVNSSAFEDFKVSKGLKQEDHMSPVLFVLAIGGICAYEESRGGNIGYGSNISFWKNKWIGNKSFMEAFPLLFHQSELQDTSVADMGEWDNNVWIWNIIRGIDDEPEDDDWIRE